MDGMGKGQRQIKVDFEAPGRPGPSIYELFQADTRPVPEIMHDASNDFADHDGSSINPERYISPEFQQLENERMWSRVWQVACHEDQIQKVGDYVVYEIAGKSLIIARTAPDTIKAYFNACLHRGRTLCEKDGHANNFRCKFHGFMWGLDGKLGFVPSRWDFPSMNEDEFRLPEAKVGRWEGFVFLNLDANAKPFEEYLGELPEHFKNWDFKNRHLVAHVGKVARANWKVFAEAFLEFFHAMATHPQALAGSSDAATRYGALKGSDFGFMISPTAIPSPYVADQCSEQDVLDAISQSKENIEKGGVKLPEGRKAREFFADMKREEVGKLTGKDYSAASDTEMVDLLVYTLYPNTTLFGGYALPFIYRFRPWGNDPEMSIMELFVMTHAPEGASPPPAPKMTILGPDETFEDSPELVAMGLGAFFNQDLGNVEWVQKGLHSLTKPSINIAKYQESEIRQLHSWIDDHINNDPAKG